MNTVAGRLKIILSHLPNKHENRLAATHLGRVSVEISPPPEGLEDAARSLFTAECLDFLGELVKRFDTQIDEVLRLRVLRRCSIESGKIPNFKRSDKIPQNWTIDSIPVRLRNRKLDLGDISPSRTELLTSAINSSVQGIQVDFDDGHCPSWKNQIQGLYNVFLAVRDKLPNAQSLSQAPILMLRPRAWNMVEHNAMVDGREVPGPLFDFGVLMFHNGKQLAAKNAGPYFYLSKVESTEEARLWNDIFTWTENRLGLPSGVSKSCVLIENILATFEMESILYELRQHCIGLNCGIWDYSASIISLFGKRPDFVISDRVRYVNIDQTFLKSYVQLLVQICHRHGALATGGMAALVLPGKDDPNYDAIVKRVCDGKLKEIQLGLDGFMVHDIGLVPYIDKLWSKHCQDDNQLNLNLPNVDPTAADLLQVPVGNVSTEALSHNISVATLFIEAWLRGSGTFVFRGAVEDSATAEISRSQVWQWIYHQVVLGDTGQRVTRKMVYDMVDRLAAQYTVEDPSRMDLAVFLFKELVTARDPPIFITTFLSNHSIFRTLVE